MSEIREAFNVWIAFVDRLRDAQGLLPLTNREVNLMREAYIAGAATVAPAPAAHEPVAWRVSDTSEPEIGYWLSEEPGASWQKSDPLYTAPPAAEQSDTIPVSREDAEVIASFFETGGSIRLIDAGHRVAHKLRAMLAKEGV